MLAKEEVSEMKEKKGIWMADWSWPDMKAANVNFFHPGETGLKPLSNLSRASLAHKCDCPCMQGMGVGKHMA